MHLRTAALFTSGFIATPAAVAADATMSSGLVDGIQAALAGAIGAAIGIPLTFFLFRKVRSYKYVAETAPPSDELVKRYQKWGRIESLIIIPTMAVLAYACWTFFCTIEDLRASLLGPAEFILKPMPVFFTLPALFSGILLAALPVKFALSRIVGNEGYQQLVEFRNRQRKIDSKRVFRHMVYVLVPLIFASVVLAFQNYAIARVEDFVIHPYFAVSARSYGWGDVKRIALVMSFRVPNGNIRRDLPYCLVEMADGFQLNFHDTLLAMPFPEQRRFAAFVAERANRPVEIDDPYPRSY
jgi:hypothetical protein